MSSGGEITVFLSLCGDDQLQVRSELSSVLERAGMKVLPQEKFTGSLNAQTVNSVLAKTSCSVHILYPQYAPMSDVGSSVSLAKLQFDEAQKHLQSNPNYKMFIWLPPTTNMANMDSDQMEFVNDVRNNIAKNMVFSNASSAIQLVDDIRSITEEAPTLSYDINPTDIFLISNQLDEMEASEIVDMLRDIVPVENLNIIQDNDMDYSELCKQQIPQSKLAVVYYKHTEDWAIPFTQQVWKKIGGASSHTPILLIGDEDPNGDGGKKFNAPKVISMIVAGELIPLEIKVQFDKVAP